ncbi:hypothetical protein CJ178_01735 [Rhodococcus sp. ACPA4]|uniref:hypothetical protein n=1 Tax=unclassified Rhodococcus (in: high G+C Gram-positive bacteria) TaxID=192944 RepID=UPI000BB14FE8|nr:hypothetical protein [Rhodococcus sp. ACPA4]PBC40497.1 hypothetical protein CJ178_01735 [Rhodococcus sp. ACPA4]
MDETTDATCELARLVEELTVLDQRRVDIGESLVHLEYVYSHAGAEHQAAAARKAFQEKYVGRIYELADGLRT